MTWEKQPQLGAPRDKQVPAIGYALRVIGVVGTVIGLCCFKAGFVTAPSRIVQTLGTQDFLPYLFVLFMTLVIGVVALFVARHVRRYGQQHTVKVFQSLEEAKRHPYVLYLRPFTEDVIGITMPQPLTDVTKSGVNPSTKTYEEAVLRMFRRFGRPLAVGRPNEMLPLPGAARLYLPLTDWKPTVTSLIQDARLVLLVIGTSPGTLWELTEAIRLRDPKHILILVYTDDITKYEQFRKAARIAFEKRIKELRMVHGPHWQPPRFPDYPLPHDPYRLPEWMPLVCGVIQFKFDWRPNFVLLDPTAAPKQKKEKVLRWVSRHQLAPILVSLASDEPDH